MPHVSELPHLHSAVTTYRSATGNNCVQRAAALMLDLPGATLVFGVVRAATPEERAKDERVSPVPFIHAWVEYRDQLLAPTTIERTGGELRAMPIPDYYRINGVTKTWRLEHHAFMVVARRWRLSSAFKHRSQRAGAGKIADAILSAAGVRYVLSDRRTILPAE